MNRATAKVIPFPGVDPAKIRPRPTCVADLPDGAKAIAVIATRNGFEVTIRPCLTAAEHQARRRFASAASAMAFARNIASHAPRRFQLIIDETGQTDLQRLLARGPGPIGFGGAA